MRRSRWKEFLWLVSKWGVNLRRENISSRHLVFLFFFSKEKEKFETEKKESKRNRIEPQRGWARPPKEEEEETFFLLLLSFVLFTLTGNQRLQVLMMKKKERKREAKGKMIILMLLNMYKYINVFIKKSFFFARQVGWGSHYSIFFFFTFHARERESISIFLCVYSRRAWIIHHFQLNEGIFQWGTVGPLPNDDDDETDLFPT